MLVIEKQHNMINRTLRLDVMQGTYTTLMIHMDIIKSKTTWNIKLHKYSY